MIFRKEDVPEFEKQGVKMRVYNNKEQCPQAAVVYQETQKGHLEEFYHSKSYFIFYIIEGEGTWYIEDEPNKVMAGDVIIIPPNKRFYYLGCLKQICITSPSWEAEFEYHVRDID
ncbi:MAG: cupin domain-containing protein [Bacteroidales bacterium]|nr:cupin domain-containing protein [Bacteroidales bacterium]